MISSSGFVFSFGYSNIMALSITVETLLWKYTSNAVKLVPFMLFGQVVLFVDLILLTIFGNKFLSVSGEGTKKCLI